MIENKEIPKEMVLAAKCAPEADLLGYAQKAGLKAIELYLSMDIMRKLKEIIKISCEFPFRYAVHAPNDGYDSMALSNLVKDIKAEVVVFHNIFWEDEWPAIVGAFRNTRVKLCIENTYSSHEALKFERRYNLGACLDLEHLEMQCGGIFEEEFIRVFKRVAHIHLTGYVYGTQLWHTHLHHSPAHSVYMLNLLKEAGYRGFVVSEAKASFQNYDEFKKLVQFFEKWRTGKI